MSPSGGSTVPSGMDFPSQRRERIDWHKLASIDLHDLTSGCPMEVLQENLTQVAFCDPEVEFDLGTVTGQRNLMKMFRLAQLTVQYLFISQDFMETQLKEAQQEAQLVSEKYQQMKNKLVQQVEEAKKMKTTNKNMRETVKHINSFAIANGIFQALKCPQCPKTFRSSEFLQSHVWRKHPSQAASLTLPQAATMATCAATPSHVTLVPSAGTSHGMQVPSTAATPLQAPVEVKVHEPVPSSIVSPSVAAPEVKVNDVDSFRLNEVERKCDTMTDNLLRLFRELEEQKRSLEADHRKKQEEVKKAWQEKKTLEEYYEAQLGKLSRQVSELQSTGVTRVSPPPGNNDLDDLRELVRRQEKEVRRLQDQIESHATENRVEDIRSPNVDGLTEELQDLRTQLRHQERKHKKSLKDMQESLQRSYEEALSSEKDKLKDIMKDIAHREALSVTPHKPPPSPKVNKAMKPVKPPTPNLATKPSGVHQIDAFPLAPPPQQEATREGRSTTQPQPTLTPSQPHLMDAQDTSESESKSETDTSYWNQSDLKVKHLQINSGTDKDKAGTTSNLYKDFSNESSIEEEESQTESEGTSESTSIRLAALLKDNPKLWEQMKNATSDVLASRLAALGIEPSAKGIKTETLNACLSKLRKDRKTLERKHENFHDLRKRLENEVRMKVDDKIEAADDPSDQQDSGSSEGNKRSSGVLSRMVKNVQSKVKARSKALTSTVSKTGTSMRSGVRDIFQGSGRGSNDVQVMSGSQGKVVTAKDAPGKESSEEEEEEESTLDSEDDSNSGRVEVRNETLNSRFEARNETLNSVKRNLFTSPGVATGSGTRPKHPSGYFDNKTYGEKEKETESESESESDTEWESEPEYENMKKEPPKRSDSLHLSLNPADLHTTPRDIWQPVHDPEPIKVKRPSGEKVTNLTRTIEQQLSGRKRSKLAGAVDITKTFEASSGNTSGGTGTLFTSPGSATGRVTVAQDSPTSPYDLRSGSESSNTIGTSMWGSNEVIGKGQSKVKQPRPSTSKVMVHSWDSEEDLDISDLE